MKFIRSTQIFSIMLLLALALSFASSATLVTSVHANGGPMVGLSTDQLSFGDQLVGTMSALQTVTVTNTGSVNLNISNLETSGDFGVLSYGAMDGPITPGGTRTIDVAFFPSSVGPKTGVLTITSDATSSPDTVDLSGNGVVGEVSLNPSPLNFGYQQVGAASTPRTVTLTNTGGADLHVGVLTITGQFALASNACDNVTLAPNATCTFGVTFTPLSLGAKTGEVSIPSDAGGKPPEDRGTPSYPHLDTLPLSGNGAYPELGVSTNALNFGNQLVGTTSTAQTVTLTNTGFIDLRVNVLGISGQFALSANHCNNLTILPGKTCTFGVTFTPLSANAKTGTVTIPSNATSSPDTVSLSGNGVSSQTTITFNSNGANDGTLRESAKDSGICNFIENPRSPLISVGDDSLRRQYVSILDFDTSSLPDDAVITGVKLSVKAMILQNDTYIKIGELTADVTNPFFGTLALLEYRDFEVSPLVRNIGTFTHAPSYYNWISMNMKPTSLSAVNKTGHTQFRLHFQKKYSDDLIKQAVRFLSGDFWIPADWPKMIITYYVP